MTLKILEFSTYIFTYSTRIQSFLSYSTWHVLEHLILAMTSARLIWYSFTPYYSLIVDRGPDDVIVSFCHFRTCTLNNKNIWKQFCVHVILKYVFANPFKGNKEKSISSMVQSKSTKTICNVNTYLLHIHSIPICLR